MSAIKANSNNREPGLRGRPALEVLGLPAFGVHVLRHSAAARLIQAGASHKTLQTVLGHRSAAFSLTVYGHLFDSDLDALAERLDERNAEWHATLSKRS